MIFRQNESGTSIHTRTCRLSTPAFGGLSAILFGKPQREQSKDVRHVSGASPTTFANGGAMVKTRGLFAIRCTRYIFQLAGRSATRPHLLRVRKNGVRAEPLVVLTSISRSPPVGLKEKLSLPAPNAIYSWIAQRYANRAPDSDPSSR